MGLGKSLIRYSSIRVPGYRNSLLFIMLTESRLISVSLLSIVDDIIFTLKSKCTKQTQSCTDVIFKVKR